MKRINTHQMARITGGDWTSILDCVWTMYDFGTDIYTSVELCALSDANSIEN